jgi:trans-aconitate 2-methyltransferase
MQKNWDPEKYLRYEQYRARPALDLMAQVKLEIQGDIVDLGCGPGNVTQILADKWKDRHVFGVDNSPEMLVQAKANYDQENITWHLKGIEDWSPEKNIALIFSNAALHWVSDHPLLLTKLLGFLEPGGHFAVQIPITEHSEYQLCIRKTIETDRWRHKLSKIWMYKDPLPPETIYQILLPFCSNIDVWVTNYFHVLEGNNPVTEWIKATGLTPYLGVLSSAEQKDFLEDYTEQVKKSYLKQPDGSTLFPMQRIFVVARKKRSNY